jgi:hypothetical protein
MARTGSNPGEVLKSAGERGARQAIRYPWVGAVMRLGFAVRGLVYGLIGILAIQLATQGRGQITDQQGAIALVGRQPFGKFLLILIAIGLAGYALWGLVRALLDPMNKGSDWKGMVARTGYLISGLSYAALLIPTVRTISNQAGGAVSGAQTSSSQRLAQSVLANSWGPWLIGAVGLAIVGAGLAQIVQGWRASFENHFNQYALNSQQRRMATRLGRFGYIARGIVFAIVGVFLVQAAVLHDSTKARGIDGALLAVSRQPYGTVLLAVIAAGLIAFGAYSIMGGLWFRLKGT